MKIVKLLFQNIDTSFLTIFLILFSFGQLQRLQLTNQIAFYAHDAVIVGYLIWQIFTMLKIQSFFPKITAFWKKINKSCRWELLLVVWILAGMIFGAVASRITLLSWLYLLRLIAYSLFTISIIHNKKIAYPVSSGFTLAGTLIGLWGLLQYTLLPDTRFLSLFGWDNHFYRLISTLLDPAFTGMVLAMTFGLWQDKKTLPQFSQSLRTVIQILLVIAIAATFSRASYLALAVIIGLQFLAKKISFKKSAVIGLVFIISIWLLPKPGGEGVNLARTSTGEARVENSHQALDKMQGGQWLWGRGLFNTDANQNYQTPSHAKLPDSLPVLLLNALGFGGTMLCVYLLAKWGKHWWKKEPIWTSLLLAVIAHSLFNNTLLQPFVFLMLWGNKKLN